MKTTDSVIFLELLIFGLHYLHFAFAGQRSLVDKMIIRSRGIEAWKKRYFMGRQVLLIPFSQWLDWVSSGVISDECLTSTVLGAFPAIPPPLMQKRFRINVIVQTGLL